MMVVTGQINNNMVEKFLDSGADGTAVPAASGIAPSQPVKSTTASSRPLNVVGGAPSVVKKPAVGAITNYEMMDKASLDASLDSNRAQHVGLDAYVDALKVKVNWDEADRAVNKAEAKAELYFQARNGSGVGTATGLWDSDVTGFSFDADAYIDWLANTHGKTTLLELVKEQYLIEFFNQQPEYAGGLVSLKADGVNGDDSFKNGYFLPNPRALAGFPNLFAGACGVLLPAKKNLMVNAVVAAILNRLTKSVPEELVEYEKKAKVQALKENAGLVEVEDEFTSDIKRLRKEISVAMQEVHKAEADLAKVDPYTQDEEPFRRVVAWKESSHEMLVKELDEVMVKRQKAQVQSADKKKEGQEMGLNMTKKKFDFMTDFELFDIQMKRGVPDVTVDGDIRIPEVDELEVAPGTYGSTAGAGSYAIKLVPGGEDITTVDRFVEEVMNGAVAFTKTEKYNLPKHSVEISFARKSSASMSVEGAGSKVCSYLKRESSSGEQRGHEYALVWDPLLTKYHAESFAFATATSGGKAVASAPKSVQAPEHFLYLKAGGGPAAFEVGLRDDGVFYPANTSSSFLLVLKQDPLEITDVLWREEGLRAVRLLPTLFRVQAVVDAKLGQSGSAVRTAALGLLQAVLFNDVKMWPIYGLEEQTRLLYQLVLGKMKAVFAEAQVFEERDPCEALLQALNACPCDGQHFVVQAGANSVASTGSALAAYLDTLKRVRLSYLNSTPKDYMTGDVSLFELKERIEQLEGVVGHACFK